MNTAQPIQGHPNYLITEDGRVFTAKGRELRPTPNHNGYLTVNLRTDGKQHLRRVHRLVALAYVPNKEGKPDVNHIDGNKRNNHKTNLEWVTNEENHWHAAKMGLLHTTPVDMLDKDGNLVRSFPSLKSAEEYVGAKRPNGTGICACLRGAKQTAYGYRWRKAQN